jgi:hypothetical protein
LRADTDAEFARKAADSTQSPVLLQFFDYLCRRRIVNRARKKYA